jgi:hypothetical protein
MHARWSDIDDEQDPDTLRELLVQRTIRDLEDLQQKKLRDLHNLQHFAGENS